jgi:hypothetical protein
VFLGGDIAGVAETTVVCLFLQTQNIKSIILTIHSGVGERWEDGGLAYAPLFAIPSWPSNWD